MLLVSISALILNGCVNTGFLVEIDRLPSPLLERRRVVIAEKILQEIFRAILRPWIMSKQQVRSAGRGPLQGVPA